MNWKLKKFEELSTDRLYELLKLRFDIFVIEQQSIYPDLDDLDQKALHLLAYDEGIQQLTAYMRILPPDLSADGNTASFGRVVVSADARGKGLARELVSRGLTIIQENWPLSVVSIEAQYYLRDFYASFGFVVTSEPFLDAGVKHVEMQLTRQK